MYFSLEKEIFLPAHWRQRPWWVLALVTLVQWLVIIFCLCIKYFIIKLSNDQLPGVMVGDYLLHLHQISYHPMNTQIWSSGAMVGDYLSTSSRFSWYWCINFDGRGIFCPYTLIMELEMKRQCPTTQRQRSFWEIYSIIREICFER